MIINPAPFISPPIPRKVLEPKYKILLLLYWLFCLGIYTTVIVIFNIYIGNSDDTKSIFVILNIVWMVFLPVSAFIGFLVLYFISSI